MTLAARRNIASTLVISGSAICALRMGTLTCSVASLIVSLSSIASAGVPQPPGLWRCPAALLPQQRNLGL